MCKLEEQRNEESPPCGFYADCNTIQYMSSVRENKLTIRCSQITSTKNSLEKDIDLPMRMDNIILLYVDFDDFN